MLRKCLALVFTLAAAALFAQETPEVDFLDHYSCAAWSPDSNFILAGTRDGGLRLWDVWQERETLSIDAEGGAVHAVAFMPDGRRFVSASGDGRLRLWDAAEGRLLLTLSGHTGAARSVALSPDGSRIYSCSADKTIKIWDAASGRVLQTLRGHNGDVNSVSVIGGLLCSASTDGTIKLWDAATGREIRTLRGHTGAVNSAALNGDATMIFSGGTDKTARLWDAETGKELNSFTVSGSEGAYGEILSAAFNPDGKTMSAASKNGGLGTFYISEEYPGGSPSICFYRDMINHTAETGTAFSLDGKFLLSCGEKGAITVFVRRGIDYDDERVLTRLAPITALASNEQNVFCGSEDTSVKVWDIAAGRQTGLLRGHYGAVNSLAPGPDGKTLLSGSDDQTIKIWNIAGGTELKTLTGMRGPVKFLSYSPDGKRVVCWDTTPAGLAKDEKNVFVWDTETWRPKGIAFYGADLFALLFTPGGNRLLTSSPVGIFKVLNGETGETTHSLEFGKSALNVVFNPGGDRVAFSYNAYDSTTKQYTYYLTVHNAETLLSGSSAGELWTASFPTRVDSEAFSPDGTQLLVSFYNDKTMRVLNSATGKELASITASGAVSNAIFSPDGRRIIAVLNQKNLGVWDRAGNELARFTGFSNGEWICVTSDGYYTASPRGDLYVRVRLGGKTLNLEEYRSRYRRPDRVAALLAGGAQ
jgi:WD40 repeat protein